MNVALFPAVTMAFVLARQKFSFETDGTLLCKTFYMARHADADFLTALKFSFLHKEYSATSKVLLCSL